MSVVFDHDLYMCCEWVYMMMFCTCRRRSRSRDRSNRKRSHSPADRHGLSRYKRSRSREKDRYIQTVTFCVLSCICLSVSNVWGLWGTSVSEEICESRSRNVKVHLKFQVCSFEPAMIFFCKTWYNKREASLSVLINSRFHGLVHMYVIVWLNVNIYKVILWINMSLTVNQNKMECYVQETSIIVYVCLRYVLGIRCRNRRSSPSTHRQRSRSRDRDHGKSSSSSSGSSRRGGYEKKPNKLTSESLDVTYSHFNVF